MLIYGRLELFYSPFDIIMSNESLHKTYAFIRLCLLLALCSYLTNSEESNSCMNRYLTINTYADLVAVNISCYGVNYDCIVYSSPPGAGCSEESLTLVGSIPSSRTKLINYSLPYGAALCSNYQTSVQLNHGNSLIVQLPRATQSGKKFHTVFNYFDEARSYKCGISALATAANIDYSLTSDDSLTEIMIDKYQTEDITFDITENPPKILKIISDAAVVVTCRGLSSSNSQLIVLEPISSEPLLIVTGRRGHYSYIVADCSTNAIVSDSSRVSTMSATWKSESCISSSQIGTVNSYTTEKICIILFTPLDSEACVSVLAQDKDSHLTAVGLPESKLTHRLVNYPHQVLQFYFSFLPSICSFIKDNQTGELSLNWLAGDLENEAASTFSATLFNEYDSVECSQPVYILLFSYHLVVFRAGYQQEELWTQFLESEGCDQIPIPVPITPPTTQAIETPTVPIDLSPTPSLAGMPTSYLAESPTLRPCPSVRVSKAMHSPFSMSLVKCLLALSYYVLLQS